MKKLVVRVMKIIGFVSAALLVVCGVVVAVFWEDVKVRASNIIAVFEEPEYAGGFAGRDEMLDYLATHRDNFSLLVSSVGDEEEISHMPEEPSPLASTKKVIVLAAYAKEVASGKMDPDEEVPVSEWERYYIPNTDGGAHPQAMENLGIENANNATATLDEIAGAMISVSDNAATDYLVDRLGQEKIRAVTEEEGLTGQQPILPISGSILVWSGPDGEGTPGLASMSRERYTAEVLRATEKYRDGGYPDDWRKGRAPIGSLTEQREQAARHETSGTAEDYARIMSGVVSGEFVSSEVSGIMSEHLDWPMQSPANAKRFQTMGAKGGSLAGIFTQAMYATPKRGDYAGEERVVVLFMRDMSASAWLGVQRSEGYGDLTNALLTDEEFVREVERRLEVE